jgi:hypothetical protein
MQLSLTADETKTLHDILHDYLPDLRRELAAVDVGHRELKRELVKREDLCDKLLATLAKDVAVA